MSTLTEQVDSEIAGIINSLDSYSPEKRLNRVAKSFRAGLGALVLRKVKPGEEVAREVVREELEREALELISKFLNGQLGDFLYADGGGIRQFLALSNSFRIGDELTENEGFDLDAMVGRYFNEHRDSLVGCEFNGKNILDGNGEVAKTDRQSFFESFRMSAVDYALRLLDERLTELNPPPTFREVAERRLTELEVRMGGILTNLDTLTRVLDGLSQKVDSSLSGQNTLSGEVGRLGEGNVRLSREHEELRGDYEGVLTVLRSDLETIRTEVRNLGIKAGKAELEGYAIKEQFGSNVSEIETRLASIEKKRFSEILVSRWEVVKRGFIGLLAAGALAGAVFLGKYGLDQFKVYLKSDVKGIKEQIDTQKEEFDAFEAGYDKRMSGLEKNYQNLLDRAEKADVNFQTLEAGVHNALLENDKKIVSLEENDRILSDELNKTKVRFGEIDDEVHKALNESEMLYQERKKEFDERLAVLTSGIDEADKKVNGVAEDLGKFKDDFSQSYMKAEERERFIPKEEAEAFVTKEEAKSFVNSNDYQDLVDRVNDGVGLIKQHDSRLNSVESGSLPRLEELSSAVGTLQEDVRETKEKLGSLGGTLSDIGSTIGDLSSTLNRQEGEINELRGVDRTSKVSINLGTNLGNLFSLSRQTYEGMFNLFYDEVEGSLDGEDYKVFSDKDSEFRKVVDQAIKFVYNGKPHLAVERIHGFRGTLNDPEMSKVLDSLLKISEEAVVIETNTLNSMFNHARDLIEDTKVWLYGGVTKEGARKIGFFDNFVIEVKGGEVIFRSGSPEYLQLDSFDGYSSDLGREACRRLALVERGRILLDKVKENKDLVPDAVVDYEIPRLLREVSLVRNGRDRNGLVEFVRAVELFNVKCGDIRVLRNEWSIGKRPDVRRFLDDAINKYIGSNYSAEVILQDE